MARSTSHIDLSSLENRSILVVDDNHSIHRDYQSVLCPNPHDGEQSELEKLEALLLGDEAESSNESRHRNFTLQSAFQGEEAVELVEKHLAKGIRYPMAFVDMRMPPGWDGLETIRELRRLDPEMRFVIVSAYSDHTHETLKSELGENCLVQIVYKPFDPREIYQLAYRIVSKWNELQASPA
ncbi:response regulator [Pelagicoccus mobilis]